MSCCRGVREGLVRWGGGDVRICETLLIGRIGIWGKLWRKGCGEAVAGILLLELVVGWVLQ